MAYEETLKVPLPASATTKPCRDGFYACETIHTHAWRLASPSVTNQTLALPSSVLGTRPL